MVIDPLHVSADCLVCTTSKILASRLQHNKQASLVGPASPVACQVLFLGAAPFQQVFSMDALNHSPSFGDAFVANTSFSYKSPQIMPISAACSPILISGTTQ
jgi:hypothetical protein|mmetsp:Transcript_49770/g.81158  ORF Transcript_49770/g.81158 Transcript_49770/m.81158 type:complete len:102 (+) Transcript_49770:1754-2059(+)